MSSEIVFTILLQHILTFDREGGGKSWGEAEVRMMLDQWEPIKCFTQTECFTAALWNDDWNLFSSYYWRPVAKYKSSVDFDSSNPVHHLFLCRISHCWTPPSQLPPPLFLDQNLDNTGPTKLLPRWSPSRSPYSSSSWSPSTSCLVINIMIIMIRRLMANIMKTFQFFSTLPIC